jgi:hypothetical protein
MFYNLFTSILNGIKGFTNDVANYLKCRSMCCNNINIYNPKSCCVQGEIKNRWVRATTPSVESAKPITPEVWSPVRRDTSTKFFTPKIK